MTHVAAALRVVLGTDDITHLVGTSPAIPGCRPTDSQPLCGVETTGGCTQPVSEVECSPCLTASTRFWTLPSWTEEIHLT